MSIFESRHQCYVVGAVPESFRYLEQRISSQFRYWTIAMNHFNKYELGGFLSEIDDDDIGQRGFRIQCKP
ncbi:hypothetical protein WM03_24690 [Burkholderia ubonensis]|nr:hypothetical protein WJ65_02885 [Burkholderia ubonensis]KWI05190.1 hypothetical protein WM02_27610 [Burkholderia ubonensis]KWI22857.1 hypothetical protein WM03_24690 [Burkholderia ubonensis]ODQ40792.1 hypothetical protein BGV63_09315 [Burkholderia ubonensis]OJA31181.1 hypothetical protein BGV58_09290 [Burkholderia ubonensis]